MPKNDMRPTRFLLKTRKNPDGSQQYVRGNTNTDQFMTVVRTPYSNTARLALMNELNKPVDFRIKKRKKEDIRNNNADRSR